MEYIVILDAGHGKHTPGKRSPDGSMREFDFTNPTTQYVGKYLKQAYPDIRVVYDYDLSGNVDTPLISRTNQANRVKRANPQAKIAYVSVHANAMGGGWSNARGIETFVMKPASQNPSGKALANAVHKSIIKETGLQDRGVKQADFHVLRETNNIPAVLVECGFYTNKEELHLLKTSEYRHRAAKGIAKGILSFLGLNAGKLDSGASIAGGTTGGNKKMDPNPSKQFEGAVTWAKKAGITNGSNPKEPATREQVMAMFESFYHFLQSEKPDPAAEPYDTHKEAVTWATDSGITNGKEPLVPATRQQVMDMLYQYDKKKGAK